MLKNKFSVSFFKLYNTYNKLDMIGISNYVFYCYAIIRFQKQIYVSFLPDYDNTIYYFLFWY